MSHGSTICFVEQVVFPLDLLLQQFFLFLCIFFLFNTASSTPVPTVPKEAGIEPRTIADSALTVRNA
jgi:hypothetical protein